MASGQIGFESRTVALKHFRKWKALGFAVSMWKLPRLLVRGLEGTIRWRN